MDAYLKIARVLKPQGIKGELKLRPFVDDINRFFDLKAVFVDLGKGFFPHAVEEVRVYKDFVYMKLEGVDDRNAAEQYRGAYFFISREDAVPLPEGAAFIVDLIGMDVLTQTGKHLGILKDVLQTGGTDVYSVLGPSPFLFAAAPDVILEKNMDKRQIILDQDRLKEVRIDV